MSETPLSPRHIQVIELVIDGYNNVAIAATLDIAENTVKRHLHTIFGKLGVQSRLDLAVTILKQRHRLEMSEREA